MVLPSTVAPGRGHVTFFVAVGPPLHRITQRANADAVIVIHLIMYHSQAFPFFTDSTLKALRENSISLLKLKVQTKAEGRRPKAKAHAGHAQLRNRHATPRHSFRLFC